MRYLRARRVFWMIVFSLFLCLWVGKICEMNVSASGETVELTVGREIYYGTYSTNYFDVDGKTAYCLEPLKDTPGSGSYAVHPLKDGAVRKGLYYVFGGPGYDTYREKLGHIGTGSVFNQDNEYCMSHCILSYLYSGKDSAFTGLDSSTISVLKSRAEAILSLPDPPEAFCAFLFNMDGSGQTMGGSGRDRTGEIEIWKLSNQPGWTDDNLCYSLAGAVFGIYRPGEDTPEWTVTTDENGYGRLENIPIGTYEIAEMESPAGFVLSEGRQEIRVEEELICRYECVNQAQYYPAHILLTKVDAETGERLPQGAASFEGAEFTVKYYAGYYDSDPEEMGVSPERTWVLRTNVAGEVELSDAGKTAGDEFYKNSAGENILPLGTVTFRESKAPRGYLINDTVFVAQICPGGAGEVDTVYQVPEVPEQVLRGDLQIVKFREDENENQDRKTVLEGIVFTITSKTTGDQIRITTDENGYASTAGREDGRGGLIYDTYVVSEINAPEGLQSVKDFEITVSEERQTLYYLLEDKRISSPVRLVKKDADSGETIPLAGAEFSLLDEEGNPITMTIHYPQETLYSTFKTDESGSFILPDRLPAGIYYFREVQAPEGYVLGEEPVRFQITEDHEWGNPFVVEFTDRPAMGRFCIRKTDQETGEAVAGVRFEIRAKEDILTPSGTVRVAKGSLAGVMVTGEDGMAWSDRLYLGKYEIRETEQASGYVLSEASYEAELKYKDQETEIVTMDIEFSNEPTTVILRKTEKGTENGLKGVKFSVWKKTETGGIEIVENETKPGEADQSRADHSETETDVAEAENMVYVTDQEGRIVLKYLSPGTYCVRETESIPGYLRDDTVWEFTVDRDGKIEGKACMEYQIENEKTEIGDTRAYWKESGKKEIYAGEGNVVTDNVILKHLNIGQEYTLRGVLADPDTGQPLNADGEPAEDGQPAVVENTFIAEQTSQEIKMEFPLDTVRFQEKKIVVFESLYLGDTLIASHKDPGNEKQTVSILRKPDTAIPTGDLLGVREGLIAVFAAAAAVTVCFLARIRKRKNESGGHR